VDGGFLHVPAAKEEEEAMTGLVAMEMEATWNPVKSISNLPASH